MASIEEFRIAGFPKGKWNLGIIFSLAGVPPPLFDEMTNFDGGCDEVDDGRMSSDDFLDGTDTDTLGGDNDGVSRINTLELVRFGA